MEDKREREQGYPSRKGEESITEGEYTLDELARGVADGTISRSKVLKVVFGGFLGGLLSLFALPARDAEARLPKTLWAVVDKDGNLVSKSRGVSDASRLDTGVYSVEFSRNVSLCAKTATISSSSTLAIRLHSRAHRLGAP